MTRPTIKDVAAKAGVSVATVSNVFSRRKPVSQDLVARVEEAAEALSYKMDRAASQLRSGRVKVVGVLVPNLNDTFFTSLISDIEGLAVDAGYQVLVASAQDDPEREAAQLDALLGWKPSGVVAVPCTNATPEPLRREFDNLPIILADRIGESDLPVDTVTVNNLDAGREAAEHLLAHGHRRIAIASSVTDFRPIQHRIQGVTEACAAAGADAPEIIEVGVDPVAGADILADWLRRHAGPTAIIAMTNVTTLAALSALARLKLEVPDDMSLVGFDDYPWMTARKVPLSAVSQPIPEIAGTIWQRLMSRMNGDALPPEHIVLEAPLQKRSSVGVPRHIPDAGSEVKAL